MQLIEWLEGLVADEQSYFRAQLLREDIARVKRLQALAHEAADFDAFARAGMRIGWTQGDARTQELRAPLQRLLELVYRSERGTPDAKTGRELQDAWTTLHNFRMERLVGCLSTPVPKPED